MKLVYDTSSVPKGLDFTNLVKMYENHHVVFWDSSLGGLKPKLYAANDVPAKLLIVDTEGKEIDIEMYTKVFKDQEYWDRELHYCKNSPIYHFSNYLTPVYPATTEGIRIYLSSIGMADLTAKDDAAVATDLWEAQKAKLVEISSNITIEDLKGAKAIIEVLKGTYEQKVADMVKALAGKVELVANGEALPDKVRTANLVEAIRKTKNVPTKYSEYGTLSGKWSSPMLYGTPYGELLNIAVIVLL